MLEETINSSLCLSCDCYPYFNQNNIQIFSIFTSPGSILADMAATLLNHRDAESIFFARLNSLVLDSVFPEGAVLLERSGTTLKVSKTVDVLRIQKFHILSFDCRPLEAN